MHLQLIWLSEGRGGAESSGVKICRAALQRGWTVSVSFPESDAAEQYIELIREIGAQYHPLRGEHQDADSPAKRLTLLTYYWARCRSVLRMVRHFMRVDPDVLLLNMASRRKSLEVIAAASILRIPIVIRFAADPSSDHFSTRKERVLRLVRRRSPVRFVSLSQHNRGVLTRILGVPASLIDVLPNGLTEEEIAQAQKLQSKRVEIRRSVLRELGIDHSSYVVLTVARLARNKGHEDLIRAIARLRDRFDHVVYLWAGDGDLRKSLDCAIEEAGLDSLIKMLGWRRDIPRLLSASDLFVLPSRKEPFGNAAIEAMLYGLPVIVSEAGGLPEIVRDGIDGWTFSTGDYFALADRLAHVFDNQEHTAEIALAGQQAVLERFRPDRWGEWVDLLDEMASRSGEGVVRRRDYEIL